MNYVILFADALLCPSSRSSFSTLETGARQTFSSPQANLLSTRRAHGAPCAVAFAQKLFGLSYGLNG